MSSPIALRCFGLVLAAACAACTAAPVSGGSAPAPSPPSTVAAARGDGVTSPVPTAAALASSPPTKSAASPSATPPGATPPGDGGPAVKPGPLSRFHAALRELEQGRRHKHVRVTWLGDSHAQADFWTGAVRSGLQKRFGNGGPGFLHLGYKAYRHNGVRFEIDGKWRMRPKRPATIQPWGDGVFGLGGILHAGYAGPRAARMELRDGALRDRELRWDLCYKFSQPYDEFRLYLGASRETIKADGKLNELVRIERRLKGTHSLKVVPLNGRPDFCGLVVETDEAKHPGVVLDNLGINGARYATLLAWNDEAWQAELARRPPDLVVLEFGGNEAGDRPIKPAEYRKNLLSLVARVRSVRPDVSCVVAGVAERTDAFWATYAVMGGRGSMSKWMEDKLASDDGIHLMPKGYEQLGALMLADLMRDYRP
jgi:lysophospholipase L1-like esterase